MYEKGTYCNGHYFLIILVVPPDIVSILSGLHEYFAGNETLNYLTVMETYVTCLCNKIRINEDG